MASSRRMINDRWKLGKKLGEGGVGAVYKAVDVDTGDEVAVKIMTPKAIAEDHDGLMTELFAREGLLEKSAGEGAVAPIEAGQAEDGSFYLVMEYLKGKDLEAYKHGGKLTVDETLPILEATLQTLRKIHHQGIIHRDIKPANIFLTDEGDVKLLDFGMADTTSKNKLKTPSGRRLPHSIITKRAPNEFIGTDGYAAPEQVEGKTATAKSDIWSLGATAYETLSGVNPVGGSEFGTEFCPVPPLQLVDPDVPDDIATVIDQALACDPRDRPSADQMLRSLAPHIQVAMVKDSEPMSLGAKLAIGVAVAGVLFGVYQVVSSIASVFTDTEIGKWFMSLPPGAWEEAERLAQKDIMPMPPMPPGAQDPDAVQINATLADTKLAWPVGTTFWKYPPGALTDASSPRKTASGAGTVVGGVFLALLAAYGVVSWKAHQLIDALQAKGIEIIPPEDKAPALPANDVVVRSVFSDVFGDSVGPDVLDIAKSHGWCYGTTKPPVAVAVATSKKASGPGSDECTLYVDLFGNQWLSGPNGIITGFRPAFNVVPGHAYQVGPMRWDGSYDVIADVTLGTPVKPKTAQGPASTIEDTLYVDTTGTLSGKAATPGALIYAWVGNLNADGSFSRLEPAARLTVNGQKTTGMGQVPAGLVQGHFYKLATDGSFTVGADITGSHS
jgi:predicted Ser/Thr protein kinase